MRHKSLSSDVSSISQLTGLLIFRDGRRLLLARTATHWPPTDHWLTAGLGWWTRLTSRERWNCLRSSNKAQIVHVNWRCPPPLVPRFQQAPTTPNFTLPPSPTPHYPTLRKKMRPNIAAEPIWLEIWESWIWAKTFRFFQGNFRTISIFPSNFPPKKNFSGKISDDFFSH